MVCTGWRTPPASLFCSLTPELGSNMLVFGHNVFRSAVRSQPLSHLGPLRAPVVLQQLEDFSSSSLPSSSPQALVWKKEWNVQHHPVGQKRCSRCSWHPSVLPLFLPGDSLRLLTPDGSWELGCCAHRHATEITTNFTPPLLTVPPPSLFFFPFSYSSKCIKEVHLGHFRAEH